MTRPRRPLNTRAHPAVTRFTLRGVVTSVLKGALLGAGIVFLLSIALDLGALAYLVVCSFAALFALLRHLGRYERRPGPGPAPFSARRALLCALAGAAVGCVGLFIGMYLDGGAGVLGYLGVSGFGAVFAFLMYLCRNEEQSGHLDQRDQWNDYAAGIPLSQLGAMGFSDASNETWDYLRR